MIKKIQIIITGLILLGCGNSKEVRPAETIKVTINAPTTSERISNNVPYFFRATPSEPVRKVEYYFDGISIGSSTAAPYTVKWTPHDMDGGEHTLSIIATSFRDNDFKTEQKLYVRLNVGDDFRGGRIFSLSGVNSGLIASTTDLESGPIVKFTWTATNTLLGANSTNGKENTTKMANAAISAAEAGYHFKSGYQHHGYDDWYIPSFDEINMLRENIYYVGGFVEIVKDSYYWSSSEFSASHAQLQNMTALVKTEQEKANYACRIRPIRKF
jgi:hypothetical protein